MPIKFRCSKCSQKLEANDPMAGSQIDCPKCNTSLSVPKREINEKSIKALFDSNADINMTIAQFMSKNDMKGGVNLTEPNADEYLNNEMGKKYDIRKTMALGGMGMILEVKDLNLKRKVAMKVILDGNDNNPDDVVRFIEEAQITGQLQHPNIIPVYDLGIDAKGSVFYTMKRIQGVDLETILTKLKENDTKFIKKYPLNTIINIFQKVCDAIAYAHSYNVIHRDLKPENIMVGDFGQVTVITGESPK